MRENLKKLKIAHKTITFGQPSLLQIKESQRRLGEGSPEPNQESKSHQTFYTLQSRSEVKHVYMEDLGCVLLLSDASIRVRALAESLDEVDFYALRNTPGLPSGLRLLGAYRGKHNEVFARYAKSVGGVDYDHFLRVMIGREDWEDSLKGFGDSRVGIGKVEMMLTGIAQRGWEPRVVRFKTQSRPSILSLSSKPCILRIFDIQKPKNITRRVFETRITPCQDNINQGPQRESDNKNLIKILDHQRIVILGESEISVVYLGSRCTKILKRVTVCLKKPQKRPRMGPQRQKTKRSDMEIKPGIGPDIIIQYPNKWLLVTDLLTTEPKIETKIQFSRQKIGGFIHRKPDPEDENQLITEQNYLLYGSMNLMYSLNPSKKFKISSVFPIKKISSIDLMGIKSFYQIQSHPKTTTINHTNNHKRLDLGLFVTNELIFLYNFISRSIDCLTMYVEPDDSFKSKMGSFGGFGAPQTLENQNNGMGEIEVARKANLIDFDPRTGILLRRKGPNLIISAKDPKKSNLRNLVSIDCLASHWVEHEVLAGDNTLRKNRKKQKRNGSGQGVGLGEGKEEDPEIEEGEVEKRRRVLVGADSGGIGVENLLFFNLKKPSFNDIFEDDAGRGEDLDPHQLPFGVATSKKDVRLESRSKILLPRKIQSNIISRFSEQINTLNSIEEGRNQVQGAHEDKKNHPKQTKISKTLQNANTPNCLIIRHPSTHQLIFIHINDTYEPEDNPDPSKQSPILSMINISNYLFRDKNIPIHNDFIIEEYQRGQKVLIYSTYKQRIVFMDSGFKKILSSKPLKLSQRRPLGGYEVVFDRYGGGGTGGRLIFIPKFSGFSKGEIWEFNGKVYQIWRVCGFELTHDALRSDENGSEMTGFGKNEKFHRRVIRLFKGKICISEGVFGGLCVYSSDMELKFVLLQEFDFGQNLGSGLPGMISEHRNGIFFVSRSAVVTFIAKQFAFLVNLKTLKKTFLGAFEGEGYTIKHHEKQEDEDNRENASLYSVAGQIRGIMLQSENSKFSQNDHKESLSMDKTANEGHPLSAKEAQKQLLTFGEELHWFDYYTPSKGLLALSKHLQ